MYCQYLSEGLRLQDESVIDLFREWNEVFYSKALGTTQSLSHTLIEMDRVDPRTVINKLYKKAAVANQQSQPEASNSNNTMPPMVNVITGYGRLGPEENDNEEWPSVSVIYFSFLWALS